MSIKQWIKNHRVESLLFLLLWITYIYFYQSTGHNEAARFDQMRAMLADRTLHINKYWWNSADVIHFAKNGADYTYPNKAPGISFVALPPFAVFYYAFGLLRLTGLPEWIYWHLVAYFTTIFTVSLLAAIAAVVIYRVLRGMGADRYLAALAIIAIWLGTLAFPYSTLFFSHEFCAAFLAIAFWLLFEIRNALGQPTSKRFVCMAGAGLLIGWSVISEYPTALLGAALFFYAAWTVARLPFSTRAKWKLFGVFVAGGAVAGILLIGYNIAAFGKPFFIPYQAYAQPGSIFPTFTQGWLRLQIPTPAQFFHALASITIYPQIGMLYLGVQGWRIYACNPVLWLIFPGLWVMIRTRTWRAEGLLVAAMTVLYVLFVTCCGTSLYDWSGASYLGTRHFVPLLPFLALPVYFGARKLKFVFYPLLAISVFYMLIATAIEPRAPFPYDNPARDLLIPDYVRSKFGQNTAGLFGPPRLLTRDSTAFNLGKLIRLPDCLQLTPLLIFWIFAGSALLNTARREDSLDHEAPDELRPAPSALTWRDPRLATLVLFAIAINLPPAVHSAVATWRHPSHGLLGRYYRNLNWSGEPVDVQVDAAVNFDWTTTVPLPPPFSVEWAGEIMIDDDGDYSFFLIADDGAILEIDGRVVVDARVLLQERTGMIYLSRGLHAIRVRYFNTLFGGLVKLSWSETGHPKQLVPTAVLIPAEKKAAR